MSRVLIVEDEPDIRLLCRLVLERGGHQVIEAENAERGLAVLDDDDPDHADPDYVVLDIRMPGMSGWDMLEQVRDDPRHGGLKVIICSAHAGPADQRRAAAEGAYAFLAKPFLPEQLLDLVASS